MLLKRGGWWPAAAPGMTFTAFKIASKVCSLTRKASWLTAWSLLSEWIWSEQCLQLDWNWWNCMLLPENLKVESVAIQWTPKIRLKNNWKPDYASAFLLFKLPPRRLSSDAPLPCTRAHTSRPGAVLFCQLPCSMSTLSAASERYE